MLPKRWICIEPKRTRFPPRLPHKTSMKASVYSGRIGSAWLETAFCLLPAFPEMRVARHAARCMQDVLEPRVLGRLPSCLRRFRTSFLRREVEILKLR